MQARVAIFSGPMQAMEFREYPLPEVGPDDMLVKIHRANICGSDLHLWRGDGPGMPGDRAVVDAHLNLVAELGNEESGS